MPLPVVPVGDRVSETRDGQMNRMSERGSLWRLFRENTKTFLNVIHHVWDDSVFSRPNVGYAHTGLPQNVIPLFFMTSLPSPFIE